MALNATFPCADVKIAVDFVPKGRESTINVTEWILGAPVSFVRNIERKHVVAASQVEAMNLRTVRIEVPCASPTTVANPCQLRLRTSQQHSNDDAHSAATAPKPNSGWAFRASISRTRPKLRRWSGVNPRSLIARR